MSDLVTVVRVIFLLGVATLAGCSSEPDLATDDPANCEQMKDLPEMYDECMAELGK